MGRGDSTQGGAKTFDLIVNFSELLQQILKGWSKFKVPRCSNACYQKQVKNLSITKQEKKIVEVVAKKTCETSLVV